MEFSSGLVALLGVLVVFTGLLVLVVVCLVLGAVFGGKKEEPTAPAPVPTEKTAQTPAQHGELVAVIAAAIAEETGRDVAGLRIHSIKKIG